MHNPYTRYLGPGALWFMVILTAVRLPAQETLRLIPANRHYLMYQNNPILLITSGEHYGQLINLDFDYFKYLDQLEKEGMNNTRVFSGTYIERKDDIKFMGYGNTLAPKPGRLITPWKRSKVAGYAGGGNKFDLDLWNEAYFRRLKDLLREAAKRHIIVELTLFGNQYNDGIYSYSPLYPDNNTEGVGIKGKGGFIYFQSLQDSALVRRQDALVEKIVNELNDFDNLYYEISNEPYNEVKDSALVDQWNIHLVNSIRKTERRLPKKHLIAANQAIVDNPNVDIANYHYVHIPNSPDFDSLLRLNKVIGMDETMGSLRDENALEVRLEAGDFIFHGGGAYNNLSWEYTPRKPQGSPGSDTVRQYLKHLQNFINSFDYTKMHYLEKLLVKVPDKAISRLLAEPGKQYALYIHHSRPYEARPSREGIWKYEAHVGDFRDTVSIELPAGTYTFQWYHPSTGGWTRPYPLHLAKGASYSFFTGHYTTDIALKIIRK